MRKIALLVCLLILSIVITACKSAGAGYQNAAVSRQSTASSSFAPSSQILWPKESVVVALTNTNQIAVVDVTTRTVAGRLIVGAHPVKIAKLRDGSRLYVANRNSGDISVVDTLAGKVELTIASGVQPRDIVLSQDGNTLYVADYQLNGVRVVNAALHSLIGNYALKEAGYMERTEPLDCCLDPSGNPVPIGRGPVAVAERSDGKKLYIANYVTRDIAVLDIKEKAEVAVWDGAVGITQILVDGTPPRLFLASAGSSLNEDQSKILVLNLDNGTVQESVEVGPQPIAMVATPTVLYVVTKGDGKLHAVSLSNMKVIRSCSVGKEPSNLCISDDGETIFVSGATGSLTAVSAMEMEVIWQVNLEAQAGRLIYLQR